MTSLRLCLLSVLSLVMLANRCHSDEAVAPAPAPTSSAIPLPACAHLLSAEQLPGLRRFGLPLQRVGQREDYVITSDSAYQALFARDSTYRKRLGGTGKEPVPTVDFTTHTLLLGRVETSRDAGVHAQQVTLDCRGHYTYAVRVQMGLGTAIVDVNYHVLVAKLPADAHVAFDVQVQ